MATHPLSTDLTNDYKESSEFCEPAQQPINIPVNEKEDAALIASCTLDELYQTVDLIHKINQGIADVEAGRTISLEDAKEILL